MARPRLAFGSSGGWIEFDEAVRRTDAKMLLITMPNATGEAVRRVMDRAVEAGLTVRIVPPVHELLDGGRNMANFREVQLADLLARHQVTTHASGVGASIHGNVVMITGAGGSIGSELARQVYGFHPSRLVLIDRAESPLYMIQRELELRALDGRGGGDLAVELGNVASRGVVKRIIEDTKPAIIFHAAACKHVPMMEQHPSEAVQVNIGGTKTVLSAAEEAGVPRFVLVSTDKAVEPSSIMGATKRMAEWLVADAAMRTGRAYVAVRFGNVLGSAGSVVPIVQSQLANGEAITVTHPEMSRYFMTIEEAGWLILDAAAIGRAGDLFVLDMGKPVKILDMVRDLIRLAGRDEGSVPIRFTGLRPGEKLHERLFYDTEDVTTTDVDQIFRVADSPRPTISKDAHNCFCASRKVITTIRFERCCSSPSWSTDPLTSPAKRRTQWRGRTRPSSSRRDRSDDRGAARMPDSRGRVRRRVAAVRVTRGIASAAAKLTASNACRTTRARRGRS